MRRSQITVCGMGFGRALGPVQVMQAQRKVKGLMRELSELQQQSHASLASQHVAGVEAGHQAQALQVQVRPTIADAAQSL